MTFTMCGVIVGSLILVVTHRACHQLGNCSECLMRTRSRMQKRVHVNMLSQHINSVEWPPYCIKRKNAVTLERSLLKVNIGHLLPIAVIKVLYKRLMEPEND